MQVNEKTIEEILMWVNTKGMEAPTVVNELINYNYNKYVMMLGLCVASLGFSIAAVRGWIKFCDSIVEDVEPPLYGIAFLVTGFMSVVGIIFSIAKLASLNLSPKLFILEYIS